MRYTSFHDDLATARGALDNPYLDAIAAPVAVPRGYRGERVVYVGEGDGGCTGDDRFHERLAKDWKLVEEIEIPQWHGVHDRAMFYER